ncbi:hypothetical protein SEA_KAPPAFARMDELTA_51 [Gordonia phage KappaFarmDelta]|nr:hypothetical protein SEA_WOCKET_50 [Gordonia phage Wocket]UVK58989.1 hypothetical protein SEA_KAPPAFARMDELTA_51 [Gordonia phage KappaFarmDelta]
MTAPTIAEQIRVDFLASAETLPCPDGWTWTVGDYAAYHRACQDGTPTLHLEFKADDDVEFVFLIGRHDLAPEAVTL